jgi:hypothetical protein
MFTPMKIQKDNTKIDKVFTWLEGEKRMSTVIPRNQLHFLF